MPSFKNNILSVECFPDKHPILLGTAYHPCLSGKAASSSPCSIHGEPLTGTRLSSHPPFPSTNSDPIAAKLVHVAHSKRTWVYSQTLGTAPQNFTGGLVVSAIKDSQ